MGDAPWWGIALASFLGIIIGAVAEHFRSAAQFRREVAREEAKERLQRAEEAYEALQRLTGTVNEAIISATSQVARGERASLPVFDDSFKRLELLVRVYMPELRPRFEAFQSAHQDVLAYIDGWAADSYAEYQTRLKSASSEYAKASGRLADAIAASLDG